jgi:HPt (histidine-containing phosphotransfer) domain-containing protein
VGRQAEAYLPQTRSTTAANDEAAAVDVEVDIDFDVNSVYDELSSDLAQLSPVIESDVVARMQEIDAALQAKDGEAARSAAHKLMSTLGFIDGERGVRLCRGLEMAANAGEWNLFARALPLLRDEVRHLLTKLTSQR